VQPIVLLAIVGATVALSVGYLGNDLDLSMAQQLGVGETDVHSPIADASVQAIISRLGTVPDFKDFIIECLFESPELVVDGSTLTCKLIDEFGSVIGEGSTVLTMDLPANTPKTIDIDPSVISNIVFDIILIVQGPF